MAKKKKNLRGRPPKYATPEELQEKIDEYFKKGVAQRKVMVGPPNNKKIELIPVPTITGLVLYLGFCSRDSFYELEKKSDFTDTIKSARTRIEREYEEQLQCGLGSGAIFALKNFGWKDTQEIEHNLGEGLYDKFKGLSNADIIRKASELAKRVLGSSART